ncbi:SatD family protein [Marinoscillum furvescens]|uniref:SatD family protein n=1 Tax=Marinoscillum furvescens DSM 4134 TaxID=1122208 RepID=A0A3D9KZH1_MARFU|nr:SatD family protein [Marinoscillum furvescens]RED93831.1 SatD family protein [Marinoscillum furvescens DSM 4134]
MFAILTGDIINSRQVNSSQWIDDLTTTLNQYGSSPQQWEIYRGDSFQLEVAAANGLLAALHLKATIRQHAGLDVRVAIGLGQKDYEGAQVTQSNGPAFVRSGQLFDELRKQTLAVRSDDEKRDAHINQLLALATLTIDHWAPGAAAVVKVAIEHPNANQQELARIMGKSQSTISEALKRAGFEEIMRMEQTFKNSIS